MAEQDRAGETGGGQNVVPGTASAAASGADRAEGAGPQSIEATTAALGDMEPSAGSGGASRTDDDRDG